MIIVDHIELERILNSLWQKRKNTIKQKNDYWNLTVSSIEPSIELSTFQNSKELHFCRCNIDPLLPTMYKNAVTLNSQIAAQLLQIGDSELGYTQDQIHTLRQRSPKIGGWVTANHINFLTFLLHHWQPHSSVTITEFGGGYGNVCRLLHKINCFPISQYTIIDLPWMKEIQQYFLSNTLTPQEFTHCKFLNTFANDITNSVPNTNLFIANHSLSELNKPDFFKYEPLLHKADFLFISMCINSVDEYAMAFHLIENFQCEKAAFENDKIIHLIMRKK